MKSQWTCTPERLPNNTDVLLLGQLMVSENVGSIQEEAYNIGAVPLIEGKTTKKQVRLTEKVKEYKMALLDKRRSKLVSRAIRKLSEIDDPMYSFQNGTIKEELQQLNNMFKMLVEIHEELENTDD